MQFKNLALEWLDVKKKYLKESTEAHYRYELYSYILPSLGEMEVENITVFSFVKTGSSVCTGYPRLVTYRSLALDS